MKYGWKGQRLEFKRIGVKGNIDVTDSEIRVEVKLNPLVPVSDVWLKREIERQMDEALLQQRAASAPPPPEPEPAPPPKPDPLAPFVVPFARLANEALSASSGMMKFAENAIRPGAQTLIQTGKAVTQLRESAGLTVPQLAARLGIDTAQLEAIEAGTAKLAADVLIRLSDLGRFGSDEEER